MGDFSCSSARDHLGYEEAERFKGLRFLGNHWSRPPGPRAYYWYLTFENCEVLHSLVRKCQEAISFPYYDLIPLPELHLTLDRVAFEGDIDLNLLGIVKTVASRACLDVAPIKITIGFLGGTRGAVGFTAFPAEPLQNLRDTLRAATLSAYPHAPVRHSTFHPHIAVAYANTAGVPAAEAIAAVDRVNATLPSADVTVAEGALVLLERRERSYAWRALSRIPLGG